MNDNATLSNPDASTAEMLWSDPAMFWSNPTAVRVVALLAVMLLVTTVMLLRRRKSSGRGAAIVCLILSIALHGAILWWVPQLRQVLFGGGPVASSEAETTGVNDVAVSMFEPDYDPAPIASELQTPGLAPLPLASSASLMTPTATETEPETAPVEESLADPAKLFDMSKPASLASAVQLSAVQPASADPVDAEELYETELDDVLGDWLNETLQTDMSKKPADDIVDNQPVSVEHSTTHQVAESPASTTTASSESKRALIPGQVDEDFAARKGAAKVKAIAQTGGDADTEAAVAKAIKFLASQQRDDGAWDPITTGAGRERSPLGLQRGGAGKRAETGLTGLALLSMLGSGQTHQEGDYQENVYSGLVYLLSKQRRDGSLAGGASVYSAHYCHAMSALALAETAAMTGDEAAIAATKNAVAYTRSTQHPITGGWRYTRGDRGDLSQLGWQAMVVDGALRSGAIDQADSLRGGIARFLNSVRRGRHGGLACYRAGEGPTPTMTAEALATRLLIGQKVPAAEIREAEDLLMANLPGRIGTPDNYYYWYYATLALHQLQDDAWDRWNEALKNRLLATQRPDGSWSDATLWGGYGGTVYTTSMATLCLESYYRHTLR